MEHHSNIVPWQLVCEQTGATLKVCPIDDRGELRLDEFDRLLDAADEDRRDDPRVERARHDQPRRRARRARPRRRRRGARGRRAGRAAPASRRPGDRLPTSTRSPATRCAARRAPASSTGRRRCLEADAAVPGRRRHDRVGHLREDDLQRAAVQVRGRARRTLPASSASARRSSTSSGLDREAARAHEDRLLEYADGAGGGRARHAAARPSAREVERAVVRHGRRASPRHRHGPRHRRRRHPHRAALRAAGHGPLRRARDGAGVDRVLQHARRRRRAHRGLHKVREVFG